MPTHTYSNPGLAMFVFLPRLSRAAFPLIRVTLALAALLALQHAHAGTLGALADEYSRVMAEGKATHQINVDNDSLLLQRDDRLYTSGAGYAYRKLMHDGESTVAYTWSLYQELYTSLDTSLPPSRLGPPDHPYAGWLYAGLQRTVQHADGSGDSIGLNVGCFGPCAGGAFSQDAMHHLLRQRQPQGWSAQLKNEIGVVLQGELSPVRWHPAQNVDITPSVHGRFGNIYTDAGAGLLLRAGRLNALPDAPTFHTFLRLDARAVGYNATLQGGYFSAHDPRAVEPKRAVGEAEIGVNWASRHAGVTVGIVRRSNEIRGLSNAIGAQNFLRLQLSYTP